MDYFPPGCHPPLGRVNPLWRNTFPVEPQSRNGKNINLRKKWGFRRFQKESQKMQKSAGKPHFSRKKCAKSAVLGTLSGIGGNPTFCADLCFCSLGSKARQEIHNFRQLKTAVGSPFPLRASFNCSVVVRGAGAFNCQVSGASLKI